MLKSNQVTYLRKKTIGSIKYEVKKQLDSAVYLFSYL